MDGSALCRWNSSLRAGRNNFEIRLLRGTPKHSDQCDIWCDQPLHYRIRRMASLRFDLADMVDGRFSRSIKIYSAVDHLVASCAANHLETSIGGNWFVMQRDCDGHPGFCAWQSSAGLHDGPTVVVGNTSIRSPRR